MPDTHYGKGSTVGTVLPTKGAVIPAAVGVDIGCGMIAVKTNLKREQLGDLAVIRHSVERSIPMSAGKFNNKVTQTAAHRIATLEQEAGDVDLDKKFGTTDWRSQLGTLGGGNHFIEICLDEADTVWVTLHSGSRGIGNKIGIHFIKEAQRLCKSMFIQLPDEDLAYLPEGTPLFDEYIKWMHWAQHFALLNRDEMMDRVLKDISYAVYGEDGHQSEFEVDRINCHHNFTQIEHHMGSDAWVTRKGAVRAAEGVRAMIPGSMGTKSYIVTGLGNKAAFESAPHGAGRRFSRGKAKEIFTMEDFDREMAGIEHRRSEVLIDELPGAYKDIDIVMENAKELVRVDHILKQILNVKGD
ncbi:RtcB family protein [Rhodopseudomonas palustris]|uniref:RtcB family protein n=1 Tax=Rhodopseudomonas palustris TaxID=1076 RepID=UPI001F3708BC